MTSRLLPGVKIISGDVDRFASADFISLSAGIARAREQYPGLPYWEEAFVPRPPWRAATPDEVGVLRGTLEEAVSGNWLEVFRIPDDLFARFEPIRRRATEVLDEEILGRVRQTPEGKALLEQALEFARSLLLPLTTLAGGNLYFNEPGLPTTSNHRAPQLLGIHTDTILDVPLKLRRFSPNRLCVNLGSENRYLLFLNRELTVLARDLEDNCVSFREQPKSPPLLAFRTAIMSTFDSYPVVKVRIAPGEAYLAPTENVIHDGCTVGQTVFDVTLHAHGHFRPQSALAMRPAVSV